MSFQQCLKCFTFMSVSLVFTQMAFASDFCIFIFLCIKVKKEYAIFLFYIFHLHFASLFFSLVDPHIIYFACYLRYIICAARMCESFEMLKLKNLLSFVSALFHFLIFTVLTLYSSRFAIFIMFLICNTHFELVSLIVSSLI